jgi:hypothetical protein
MTDIKINNSYRSTKDLKDINIIYKIVFQNNIPKLALAPYTAE